MKQPTYFFLLTALTVHLIGCHSPQHRNEVMAAAWYDTLPAAQKMALSSENVAGNFSSQQIVVFDSTYLTTFINTYPGFKPLLPDLRKFYRQRNYTYAWYESDTMIEQAAVLYNRIQHIDEEGIVRPFPHLNAYISIMNETDSMVPLSPANPTAELMLTAQYLYFARLVWEGMGSTASEKNEWFIPRKKLSYAQIMDDRVGQGNLWGQDSLMVYKQYHYLKFQLKKLKEIEQAGGFPYIKPRRRPYQPGDVGAEVQQIRKYLSITTDDHLATNSTTYDEAVADAVREFQRRHGLQPNGSVGPATIQEMNVPVEQRIRQVIVNMERCRWIPLDMKNDYILINIPAFSLYVYEEDSLQRTMRVVVGKTMNKTAIFTGQLNAIVLNPYWYVPPGILKKELLPQMARNPSFLRQNNMEWYQHTIRQRPGPANPLGKIKFVFPNRFSIYLHDTPSQSLFEKEQRAFSHGCIRLQEPRWLCNYLLRSEQAWDQQKIDSLLDTGKEFRIALSKKIPVFITYFTAWVDEKGHLQFRKDIYQQDARLSNMLLHAK